MERKQLTCERYLFDKGKQALLEFALIHEALNVKFRHDCEELQRTQLHFCDLLFDEVMSESLADVGPVVVVQVGNGHCIVSQSPDDRVALSSSKEKLQRCAAGSDMI
jgi:hypothetical protein